MRTAVYRHFDADGVLKLCEYLGIEPHAIIKRQLVADSQIIAQQARYIAELDATVTKQAEMISCAIKRMVCIGGPLNDNRLHYTPEQLREWRSVFDCLEG